ncbi:MAG: hypothetical protein AAFR38_14750 [Planctomycetota bacterium]
MPDFKHIGFPEAIGKGVFFFGAGTASLANAAVRGRLSGAVVQTLNQIDPTGARNNWYQLNRESAEHPNGFPVDPLAMPAWIRQRLFEPAGINCSVQTVNPSDTVYCIFGDPINPDVGTFIICYESFAIIGENGAPISTQIQVDGTLVDCQFRGTLAHAIEPS